MTVDEAIDRLKDRRPRMDPRDYEAMELIALFEKCLELCRNRRGDGRVPKGHVQHLLVSQLPELRKLAHVEA